MKKLINFLPVFAILALSYYAFQVYEKLGETIAILHHQAANIHNVLISNRHHGSCPSWVHEESWDNFRAS